VNDKPTQVPVVYVVDGCVIDLRQVAVVICYAEAAGNVCRVILVSGVSFTLDMKYSRSLIQAVEWSRYPGSAAHPKAEAPDQVENRDNSWLN